MEAGLAMRVERQVDGTASTLFAGAVGYAAYVCLAPRLASPVLVAECGAAAALALLLSYRTLSAVQPRVRRSAVSIFDVREIGAVPSGPAAGEPAAEEPLLLDDILAELAPDSRVVRLFDPASMPSPGELRQRIDERLDWQPSPGASADAAQALHDALADLRRSLR